MGVSSLQLGNTAGVAWNLAQGLALLGHQSLVVDLEPSAERFRSDVSLFMTPGTPLSRRFINFLRVTKLAWESNVVHFHFGIRPFGRFLRRTCRAPFFAHYHGSDLRRGFAGGYRGLADGEFVATPDLRRWAPQATWIPNPYGLSPTLELVRRTTPVVGHFPSNPTMKRTDVILSVVENLRRDLDFKFKLVTGVSHEEALEEMRNCDIVIDQVSEFGVYGMVSVEAMAMGKVVLSSINQGYYDRCPIVSVDPANLTRELSSLLTDQESWVDLGVRGREYVARIHDPLRVARLVVAQYEKHL